MIRAFLLSLGVHALSLWATSALVPGIRFSGGADWTTVLVVALIFGLVNALLRPLVSLATCAFYVLTLGLFHFVVNALMLMVTSWLAGSMFQVDGFVDAFVGGLVMSFVGTVLAWLLGPAAGGPGGGTIVVVKER